MKLITLRKVLVILFDPTAASAINISIFQKNEMAPCSTSIFKPYASILIILGTGKF